MDFVAGNFALRARVRRKPLVVYLAAALMATSSPNTCAANLPVTSCTDDGSPGTLRSVIAGAQAGDVVDMTHLACGLITLTRGPIDTSLFGTGLIGDLTLTGPGRNALTISAGGRSAVFSIGQPASYGTTFTVRDLTIAHGSNYAAPACMDVMGGDLVLDDVTLVDCHATQASHRRGGGAIGVWGNLFLTDSTISDSSVTAVGQSTANGGGAWAIEATLVRSTISGCSAIANSPGPYEKYRTSGGGVYAYSYLTIIDSTIAGNSAAVTAAGDDAIGGGAASRWGLQVSGSTLSGNNVDGNGGGLSFSPPSFPPRPDSLFGTPTISNSTFAGNNAEAGSAIYSAGGLDLMNDTIASNTTTLGGAILLFLTGTPIDPYSLHLYSTIVANNATGDNPTHAADIAVDPSLPQTVIGSNSLVGAADSVIVLPPDTLDGDPLLLPLAGNGGPTLTMALASGSPAIGGGSNPDHLDTDQRGSPWVRTFGPAPDIGAYEAQPPPDPIFANGFDP